MLDIFYGIVTLAFVAFIGIFLALMIEYGYTVKETFWCIVEAMQDIKKYKANQGTKGS